MSAKSSVALRATRAGQARPLRLLAIGFFFALLPSFAADGDGLETWPLPDGTAVLLLEDHRAPTVSVTLEFPAGTWSPWAQEHHASEAFSIQLFDPDRSLLSRADRLSVNVSASMGPRASTIHGSCLAEDLGALVELMRDVMTNRDFDEKELVRWRKARRIRWESSLKDPHFRKAQATARLFFTEDDPRRRAYETPDDVVTNAEVLLPVRDAILRLPGRTIAVAGGVTRAELEPLIGNLLPPPAQAPEGLAPVFRPLSGRDARPALTTVTMPRLTQVYFSLVRESPTLLDDDYPAFVLANHVLGGHFFSRLYVALRHEGGETYGASARSTAGVEPGTLALQTFTRTGNAAATEAKIRKVLAAFHEGGVTEEERATAASYMLGRRPFGRQHPSQVLARRLAERRLGLPLGFYDAVADRAAALTLEEVNVFVKRFYDPAAFRMIRVESK